MKPTIKVAVADDHPIYRLGLCKLLEPEPDLTLVGEASNGMEAVLLAEKYDPDILLLDLKMPVMDGIEVLSELAKRKLRTRVILMMANADRDKAVRGVRLGARGILFKDTDPSLLAKSVRKVFEGEVWIDNPILSQALETLVSKPAAPPGVSGQRDARLSSREMEVVRCVAMGLRNKEVADKLGVSEATVKNHLTSIYSKLGVSDRLELILYAIHNRIVHV
ncbi:MAG: response regulator transcription factor [Acidobacteria bacterium]|nr:response regulator transcription factor [Acidobacteriota bacterium]